jgi:hypothetical protein
VDRSGKFRDLRPGSDSLGSLSFDAAAKLRRWLARLDIRTGGIVHQRGEENWILGLSIRFVFQGNSGEEIRSLTALTELFVSETER